LNTNLIGTDFRKVNFIYDNENEIKQSFLGSIYNSQIITMLDIYYNTPKNASNYCKLNLNIDNHEKCVEAIMNISESSEASKFPDTFDPKKYNLIDVSDFINFLKNQKTN
jgi:hypothetical protein